MLTTPFRFEAMSKDIDIWWRACELREGPEEAGVSMARTAFQRVFEVHEIRLAEEKVLLATDYVLVTSESLSESKQNRYHRNQSIKLLQSQTIVPELS